MIKALDKFGWVKAQEDIAIVEGRIPREVCQG